MNDLIQILKQYAPALATAATGHFGGLVVNAIANKIGVSADVGAVTTALQADPSLALKLQEIDLEQFKVEAQDRDSARKREVEIATSGPWYSKMVTPILALSIAFVWGFIQWHLLNSTVAPDMREIVVRLLGNLDAAFMLVLSYYFGASHKH